MQNPEGRCRRSPEAGGPEMDELLKKANELLSGGAATYAIGGVVVVLVVLVVLWKLLTRRKLWAALADRDTPVAFKATLALCCAGEDAVAYLREHVAKAPPDGSSADALIGQLDSDRYAERQEAWKKLADMGPQAAGAMRAALKKTQSAEVRQRLRTLLARLDRPTNQWTGLLEAASGRGGPRPDRHARGPRSSPPTTGRRLSKSLASGPALLAARGPGPSVVCIPRAGRSQDQESGQLCGRPWHLIQSQPANGSPRACRFSRSSTRSQSFIANNWTVARPIGVRPTTVVPSQAKWSVQRSRRG